MSLLALRLQIKNDTGLIPAWDRPYGPLTEHSNTFQKVFCTSSWLKSHQFVQFSLRPRLSVLRAEFERSLSWQCSHEWQHTRLVCQILNGQDETCQFSFESKDKPSTVLLDFKFEFDSLWTVGTQIVGTVIILWWVRVWVVGARYLNPYFL